MEKQIKPFTVAIAHQKGGVGKSTVTSNLAVELNKLFDLTVIDQDPQQHTFKFNQKRKDKFKMKEIKDQKDLVNFLKSSTGITLIDLGGYDSDLARATLFLADLIIIPVSDSSHELDGLMVFKKLMENIILKNEAIQCKVLVNRVHHNDTSTKKALKKFIAPVNNFDVFETVIPTSSKYKTMLSTGKSITEITSGSPAIIFNQFRDEVIKIIKG